MDDQSAPILDGPISIRLFAAPVGEGQFDGIKPPATLRRHKSGSSIVTISDLGFDAAPEPASLQNCDCSLRKSDDNLFDQYMDVHELRLHLNLPDGPQDTVIKFIRKAVEQRLLTSKTPISEKNYLPIADIELIFCLETIKAIVRESQPTLTHDEIRHRVLQIQPAKKGAPSRQRILGILTLMDTQSHMNQFIDDELWDSDLPISTQKDGRNASFFEHWDMNHKVLFDSYQESFFVPFFNFQADKLSSYCFNQNIILPWQECAQKSAGGGGVVYKIAIHPNHHNFRGHADRSGKQYFALKEIHSPDRDMYKKELSALERTFGKMQNDKHLIKLLLTFQHGQRFFLIFEWADGNLEEFCERFKARRRRLSDQWVVSQCFGIATALKRIHGLSTWQKKQREQTLSSSSEDRDYGRHGDIKARNILWFDSYEGERHLLVLSDLGLTRYHSQLSRSRVRYTDLEGTTHRYEAPEFRLQQNISSRYDIWSLGCVFFELCIWYFLGAQSVKNFNDRLNEETKPNITNFDEDNFFNVEEGSNGSKTAIVKPAVQEIGKLTAFQWTDKVLDQTHDSGFARDMLNLVTKHMLVVNSKQRSDVSQVCTELLKIKELHPRGEEQPALESQRSSLLNGRRAMDEALQHAGGEWGDATVSSSRQSSFSSGDVQRPPRALFDVVDRATNLLAQQHPNSQDSTQLDSQEDEGGSPDEDEDV